MIAVVVTLRGSGTESDPEPEFSRRRHMSVGVSKSASRALALIAAAALDSGASTSVKRGLASGARTPRAAMTPAEPLTGMASDDTQPNSLAEEGMDGRVLFPDSVGQAACCPRPRLGVRFEFHRLHGRADRCGGGVMRFTEKSTVLDDGLLDGLGKVGPDVPAIRDMDCFGGADTPGLGKRGRAISADHFDTRGDR
ncbi:hypothetical protein [Streptomyces sp. NPDC050121]|uniref:hypothetical protein n=1 Tax=Streptomyces sp. NPDC050121 TaxID=3365601 RepID=UPI0037AE3B49